VPDELELEQIIPFDFFELGQPIVQLQQNDLADNEQQTQQQEQQENFVQDQ